MKIDLRDAPETFEEIRAWLAPGEGDFMYAAGRCDRCHRTGYSARNGVFEIMPASRELSRLFAESQPTRTLGQQALADGMISFRQAALLKVASGDTTVEEVFRVLPAQELLADD